MSGFSVYPFERFDFHHKIDHNKTLVSFFNFTINVILPRCSAVYLGLREDIFLQLGIAITASISLFTILSNI